MSVVPIPPTSPRAGRLNKAGLIPHIRPAEAESAFLTSSSSLSPSLDIVSNEEERLRELIVSCKSKLARLSCIIDEKNKRVEKIEKEIGSFEYEVAMKHEANDKFVTELMEVESTIGEKKTKLRMIEREKVILTRVYSKTVVDNAKMNREIAVKEGKEKRDRERVERLRNVIKKQESELSREKILSKRGKKAVNTELKRANEYLSSTLEGVRSALRFEREAEREREREREKDHQLVIFTSSSSSYQRRERADVSSSRQRPRTAAV